MYISRTLAYRNMRSLDSIRCSRVDTDVIPCGEKAVQPTEACLAPYVFMYFIFIVKLLPPRSHQEKHAEKSSRQTRTGCTAHLLVYTSPSVVPPDSVTSELLVSQPDIVIGNTERLLPYAGHVCDKKVLRIRFLSKNC